VTVYSVPRSEDSLNFLDPDTPAGLQALARLLDAVQKPRVVFELTIEPIVLGREADHPRPASCYE